MSDASLLGLIPFYISEFYVHGAPRALQFVGHNNSYTRPRQASRNRFFRSVQPCRTLLLGCFNGTFFRSACNIFADQSSLKQRANRPNSLIGPTQDCTGELHEPPRHYIPVLTMKNFAGPRIPETTLKDDCRLMKSTFKTAALTGLVLVWFYQDAHAYLDPSTGSFVFQSVVAGLLGAAYVVKSYWKNVRTRLNHVRTTRRTNDDRD